MVGNAIMNQLVHKISLSLSPSFCPGKKEYSPKTDLVQLCMKMFIDE
jgi:hypothetical protein